MSSEEVHANNRQYELMGHHSEEHGKLVRKKIWLMFWVLLAVTAVEVVLGIFLPDKTASTWPFVKWSFIILTLFKAYGIVAYYMHMRDEWKNFAITVVVPYACFVLYLIYICLTEALAVKGVDDIYNM